MPRRRDQITAPDQLPELFRESRYAPLLSAVGMVSVSGTRREIRARLREHCDDIPGVYGMVTSTGQLIYVGMSSNLRRRLQSYFSSKVSRRKERRIGSRATMLIWQPAAHELVARLRESELIRLYRPGFNVQGHPTQMKLGYLVLTDQAAPSFTLSSRIPRRYAGLWGPLPLTRFLKTAVGQLNHHFGLRDCPQSTPIHFKNAAAADVGGSLSATFTPCLRADLKTCLAPCIQECSRTVYARALQAARKFLNGDVAATFTDIEQQMRQAVSELKFERAAALRDRMKGLGRINLNLRRFHDWTSAADFIYPIRSTLDGEEWWLIVRRGIVASAWPCPRSREAAEAMLQRLIAPCGSDSGSGGSPSPVTGPDEFASSRLLFRWFRHVPEEKERQLSLAKARQLCQSKCRRPSRRSPP